MTTLTDREMLDLIKFLSVVDGYFIAKGDTSSDCIEEQIVHYSDFLCKKLEESKS